MNNEASFMAANAIAHAAEQCKNAIMESAWAYDKPHVLMRPKLSIDGNQWCALYGDDLQNGCAGFGDTPAHAMRDFDTNWHGQKIVAAKEKGE